MISDNKDPVFLRCLEYGKEVTGHIRIYYPGWKNKFILFSWENVTTKEERNAVNEFLKKYAVPGVILFPLSSLPDPGEEEESDLLEYGVLLTGEEDLKLLAGIKGEWEERNRRNLTIAATPAERVPDNEWEEKEDFTGKFSGDFDFFFSGRYSFATKDPLLRPDFFTIYAMVLRDENAREAKERLERYLITNYFQSPLSCCRIHTVAGKAPLLPEKELLELLEENKKTLWLAKSTLLREYLHIWQNLRCASDGKTVVNMGSRKLYLEAGRIPVTLAPGATLYQRGGGEEPICLKVVQAPALSCENLPSIKSTSAPNGTMLFPGGKSKALTFSYDDGSRSDAKLIRILDQFGMKGTFNLNSNTVLGAINAPGSQWSLATYKNHEIATHNFRHISFAVHPKEQILGEIYWDRRVLEALTGRIITGHAYASSVLAGAVKIAQEILKVTGITYARVTSPSGESFALPQKWLYWEPTCHHSLQGDLLAKGESFLKTDGTTPRVMFVWGHVSELDKYDQYGMMETFCKRMAEYKEEIFFGTNGEIADYVQAWEKCRRTHKGKQIKNLSSTTLYAAKDGSVITIAPGETVEF